MAVHNGAAAQAFLLPLGGEQQGIGQLQRLGDAPGSGGLYGFPLAQALQADPLSVAARHAGRLPPGLHHLPKGRAGRRLFVVLPGLRQGELLVHIVQVLGTDLPQPQMPQKGQHPLQALPVVDQCQVFQARALFQFHHIFGVLGKGLPPVCQVSLPALALKHGRLLFRLLSGPLLAPALGHMPGHGVGGQLFAGAGVPPLVHADAVRHHRPFLVSPSLQIRHSILLPAAAFPPLLQDFL